MLASALNLRNDNPCDRVLLVLRSQNGTVQRGRLLLHKAAVVETVRASASASPPIKAVFEFLMLAAARSGEERLATWDEIDTAGQVRTIFARRMKAKREHLARRPRGSYAPARYAATGPLRQHLH